MSDKKIRSFTRDAADNIITVLGIVVVAVLLFVACNPAHAALTGVPTQDGGIELRDDVRKCYVYFSKAATPEMLELTYDVLTGTIDKFEYVEKMLEIDPSLGGPVEKFLTICGFYDGEDA